MEENLNESLSEPQGCWTALVIGFGVLVAGAAGLVWVLTVDPVQFPGGLPLDLGRAWGYAVVLGVPSLLVALLLRNERYALWRGFGLALVLAAGHAALAGTLLAIERELAYPGLPAPVMPVVTLAYGLVAVLFGRRRFFGRPAMGPLLLGIGLGLLVSAGWVIVGALGTFRELGLAVVEAASNGLLSAVLVASLFFYDEQFLARRPFWAAIVVAVTFGALQNATLAVRGYWVQGILLSQGFAALGYLGGVLLTAGEEPKLSRLWWATLAYFSIAMLLPFAWTEGLEGDWMLDEMGPAWWPGAVASLGVAFALGWLALALRGWLARVAQRPAVPGVFSIGALALTGGLYAVLGQPGVQPEVFFVMMADQADTAFAQEIAERDARTSAVYEALTAHALDDQADLRAFLDERGVSYTPYYLVNGIEVAGSRGLRGRIAARDDVARVLNSPHTRPLRRVESLNFFIDAGGFQSGDLAWGVNSIDAERVWEDFGVTGEGIIMGHADSGVDWLHPALRANYLGSEDSHDYTWFDPWEGTTEPTDRGGHGTHTLGTAAGQDGIGVAPGVAWLSCRNLASNLGNPAYYLDCMQFLFAPHPLDGDPFVDGDPARGAHVTNNSWGCPPEEGCDGLTLAIGVDHLRHAGQMMVVSAGNEGPDCDTVSPPASADSAFTVGAAFRSGEVTGFSSRGPVTVDGSGRVKPDIVAPGSQVPSSVPSDDFPGADYGLSDGTSMAGPHVAGVVALLWSANPDLIGDIDATEAIIAETAEPRDAPDLCGATEAGANNVYGFGLINAYDAVERALARP